MTWWEESKRWEKELKGEVVDSERRESVRLPLRSSSFKSRLEVFALK